MEWIIVLIVGALVGWLASMVMKTDEQQGPLANIVIGIVGSILAKYVFVDLLGIGGAQAAGSFSFGGVLWGVAGAALLIFLLRALKVMR